MTIAVGIYVYDEVEVLDFAGPFEVFCTAARVARRRASADPPPFDAFTVGENGGTIEARGRLRVTPHHAFGGHPAIDLLVVPGGVITAELEKPAVISWIAAQAAGARLCASVCTGAFLLGKAGLLEGLRATTHWEDVDDLQRLFPAMQVETGPRWVDQGRILTSAGISAGLDLSLHLVARLAGGELAQATARQMDYDWRPVP